MRARTFSAFWLGFLALLAVAPMGRAAAQAYGPPPPFYDPRYHDPRDGVQPLDRLLPGIRRAHPGDFYDAEGPTYGPQGDPHYHLKWMTPDGRIIWYDTDARSGRVLRSSPGRDSFDSHQGPPPPGYGRPYPPQMPPPPGYGRPYPPGGFGPGYTYGPRFAPQFARPYGGMGGGGHGRH